MDGKLVFSKLEAGRFPQPSEVGESIIHLLLTRKQLLHFMDEIYLFIYIYSNTTKLSVCHPCNISNSDWSKLTK